MNQITSAIVAVFAALGAFAVMSGHPVAGALSGAIAVIVMLSLKMANTWEKFVILRAGKLHAVKGPGLFGIIPVVDNIVAIIDERIQTTAFNAEQALTRDTVPVNVDAVIFWHVHDAQKAALAITNFQQAIDRVAQTSLREMIGSSMLAALLSERKQADLQLCESIGKKPSPGASPWARSKSAMSPFRLRCKTPCRVRRRPNARNRPASSSARPKRKSPASSWRQQKSMPANRRRCNCGR